MIVFGACSGAYHLYLEKNPRKVLVAVDSSFPMKSAWSRVPRELEIIEDQRYTAFSLVTEKNRIYSWSPELKLSTIVPSAPTDFSKLTGPENQNLVKAEYVIISQQHQNTTCGE